MCLFKKIIPCFILIFIVSSHTSFLFSQAIKQEQVVPFVPKIMGMGNGFVAQAHGLHSLWTNPAGLASKFLQHDGNNREVTVFALSMQSQPFPAEFDATIQNVTKLTEGDTSGLGSVTRQLQKTGLRLGVSLYGGYLYQSPVIGSFGIALTNTVSMSSFSRGSILATELLGIAQSELMLGYAYEFNFNAFHLRIGASARPLLRTYNTIQSYVLFDALAGKGGAENVLENTDGLHGWGIGADVGVQMEWLGILLGVSARDIYTQLFYNAANISRFFTGQEGFNNPPNNTYIVPLSLEIGIGYRIAPQSLKHIFIATPYVQISDPLDNTNTDPIRSQDFAKHVHLGVNFEILPPFFNVQIGLNQGYPTLGIGIDFWVFDVSFVAYAQEEGLKIRELASPGLGGEIAFRW